MTEIFPQWPVKLKLIRVDAPRFRNADLVLVADCAPLACPDLHQRFLTGRAPAIGCPKFDDLDLYREKLTTLVNNADLKSLLVVYLEVPCCCGLPYVVRRVCTACGKDVALTTVRLSVAGQVLETASS